MKFHHVGIPSAEKRAGEVHLEAAGLFVTPVEDSPYQIEWLRFEPNSGMPAELKTMTHVAFEVADLRSAMAGKRVVLEPFSPVPGLNVAFIIDGGALVELMQRTNYANEEVY